MTTLKERILYLIDYKGDAKEKIFERMKVSYSNFKGDAKKKGLNSDTIVSLMAIYPDANPNWLLTGNGEMLRGAGHFVVGNEMVDSGMPKVVVVNEEDIEGTRIPIVQGKAYAGYLSGYSQEAFIKELPMISVSKEYMGNKTLRGFTIEGDSMEPHIITRDVVIGEYISSARQLQTGTVGVFVTREDGVVCKRFGQYQEGNCLLMSDNQRYPPSSVLANEIVEVWKVIGLIRKLLI